MNVCIDPDYPSAFPYRGEAFFFAVIAIAIIAWLYIRPFKWLPHRIRRLLLILCYAALPVAIAFIFVPRTSYYRLRSTIVSRCQAWIEPNYLNRVARFYWRNVDIVTPTADDGLIITDEIRTDLDVEIDKNGRSDSNQPSGFDRLSKGC